MTTTSPITTVPRHPSEPAWRVEDSIQLYHMPGWGKGYFTVNELGHVVVRPDAKEGREIDLLDVVEGLRQRDIHAPVLIRFSDILRNRLQHIHGAFADAIAENEYSGKYTAVYPIKVNQQRPVVEEVFRWGEQYGFGLEVGSKPELLAVMALTADSPDRIIICNGFKDRAYIEAVTLATKLGRRIIPVIENFNELRLLIEYAQRYHVRPKIGVRVKLASAGAGRWRESAGARSKFGLFVSEVVDMVKLLQERDMLDCLQLVHCHIGSQIQDIRRVKDALVELCHVYAELAKMGANMQYIDVGGGLGVDYDGSQTNYPSSMNYTLEEYASDVVYRIAAVCKEYELPHPTIISESGRAIAAYQSVLVFNVLGTTGPRQQARFDLPEGFDPDSEDTAPPIRDLHVAYSSVNPRRLIECYHDAVQARENALQLFNLGYLSLEMRALAERMFWATCQKVVETGQKSKALPEELEDLEVILSETYFCNFSIFQSLPDCWAIDQLFPIMPIHRLNEKPERTCILGDITCDSDGRIDEFVDPREVRKTLPIHPLRSGQEYYLAVFLVGAYQETLGDLHNLFGDTHVVHVRLHEEGGWWIDELVKGDTAKEVLSYVQYDAGRLYPLLQRDCEHAVRDGRLTITERRALLQFYETELNGYTYLTPE